MHETQTKWGHSRIETTKKLTQAPRNASNTFEIAKIDDSCFLLLWYDKWWLFEAKIPRVHILLDGSLHAFGEWR